MPKVSSWEGGYRIMEIVTDENRGTFKLKRDFNMAKFKSQIHYEMFTTLDLKEYHRSKGAISAVLSKEDVDRAVDSGRPILVYHETTNHVADMLDYYNLDELKAMQLVKVVGNC